MKTLNFTKIFLFIALFGLSNGKAQKKIDFKSDNKEIINNLNTVKTGNWKDVFTDYMQLAFKDLTGEKKSFAYKATLFSLKAKADSKILIDSIYAKAKFSRNFQIIAELNLDNDYKFQGFTYGFDWAIFNKRDTTIKTLADTEADSLYKYYVDNIIKTRERYNADLKENKDPNIAEKIKNVREAIEASINDEHTIPLSNFPEDFQKYLVEDYSNRRDIFNKAFQENLGKIKRQPLLTVGFNSQFYKDSKFLDKFNIHMVYLQGIKSKNNSLEIDFRNKFRAKDSIITSVLKRKEFSSQLGLNISLMKVKDKSIIEFKPSFEYTKVFSGLAENEKDNICTANADLRIRILNNLWLPLILKYDMENNNLFGFLNVSFNFDAIKDE